MLGHSSTLVRTVNKKSNKNIEVLAGPAMGDEEQQTACACTSNTTVIHAGVCGVDRRWAHLDETPAAHNPQRHV